MVTVKFIEDFANKVIDDTMVVDGQLASKLIADGVAELVVDQSEAVTRTVLSKKRVSNEYNR